MFRILIVDDEPSVVNAIFQTMPWRELDIEEALCAYSAREALAIVERQYVDIVLTDIRMPGMDGIQLMQAIRTYSSRVKFILLTGHAEFEYAQQALKLDAADYLLKPVRDETLMQSIRQLTQAMRKEWTDISSQQSTMQYIRQHLPTLRSDLLRNLLEGRISTKDAAGKLQLLELPYHDGDSAYPAVVRMERPAYSGRHLALMEYSVINIAEEVMGSTCELWSCKDVHGYQVMVIKPRNPGNGGSHADSVSRLLSQWQHLVHHYLHVNISVVYGTCEAFPYDLPDTYERAVQTLRRRVGSDAGLLLTAGAEAVSVVRTASVLHSPPSISHLFSAGLWEDAREKLRGIFADAEAAHNSGELHADFLSEIYHTLLSACYHYAHSNGQTAAQALQCEEDISFYQSTELVQSVPMLKNWAFEVCRRLSVANSDEIQDARESLIEQIQEYIHVHLAEDVSLQTLADHVGMHPVYLSKIYKMITGEGLKDYLSRLRMERAVQLLDNKDYRVYEIAGQIGYLNTAYFIKVFKKTYGVTPQEYRDKQGKG
ncbi:response regulator [Paenibacillus sp. J5C_2022]|uniref:response regulator n=1 Tax=Paenibacillus sp. J5C2022 TaxID=2977129 RepID=UPI0021D0A926|nr:response regulator [Paenibacillus sp. J5C2022]MCU6710227.1 response regulator [Paenibacillus sp. J5C2022]